MFDIRRATNNDWETIWPLVQDDCMGAGESYPYSPDINKVTAYAIWMADDIQVCTASYIVSTKTHGKGIIAHVMHAHSLSEALTHKFKTIQLERLDSTDTAKICYWKNRGFELIYTIPKAFPHREKGLVDAYIMYRPLE